MTEAMPRPCPDEMHYKQFDAKITDKYDIVLEGWPLSGPLRNPSSIGSRLELDVVTRAFESDVARFRRLSIDELEAWREARFQNILAQSEIAPLTNPPASDPSASPAATPLDASTGLETQAQIANTVLSNNSPAVPAASASSTTVFPVSNNVLVQKKARKTRSDAGKKRGPNARTKRRALNQEDISEGL